MTSATQRNVKRLVEGEGLQLLELRHSGGDHLRATVADGERHELFIFPLTPSDTRAQLHMRALLRRFARGQSNKIERKRA